MRILIAVLAFALLTVSAEAQQTGGRRGQKNQQNAQDSRDPAKDKASEQAYKDALKRIPDANEKPDPWRGIR